MSRKSLELLLLALYTTLLVALDPFGKIKEYDFVPIFIGLLIYAIPSIVLTMITTKIVYSLKFKNQNDE